MTDRMAPSVADELFRDYRANRKRRTRNQLVEAHMGFAHHLAKRYRNRGIELQDLNQVALLALVKAVDRFDPDNGAAFTTFAGRTIEGELKRHFRDTSWALRVPRSVKELHLKVRRTRDELTHRQGSPPTVAQVAAELEVEVDEVLRAMTASAAFASVPLDPPRPGDEDSSGDSTPRLASTDQDLTQTPDRVLVERLVATLEPREAEIVKLRFYDELTQTEIADRVGISQMHVSRLLRRSLDAMATQATETKTDTDPG